MVLCELLIRAGADFSMAHCNFQLRGSDSLEDELFVVQRAEDLGLQIHVKRFETKQYASAIGLSTQMAARNLRYSWFDSLLGETRSEFLLTAHHADDNLETFLINLSRGSGLRGLTGIPERQGQILRPLLPFSRGDILNFATSNHIPWREDSSNAEDGYLRNRIRNRIIPVMKETFPYLLSSFQKTLSHLTEAESIADDRLREVWGVASEIKNGITRIDIAKIRSFGDERAYLYGLLNTFGFTQWDDIEKLLTAQPGKMIFSNTHRLLKDREDLLLQSLDSIPDRGQDLLISQGQDKVSFGVHTLNFTEFSKNEFGGSIPESCRKKEALCVDRDKLNFPLRVRKWQKGDYFYPKGMKGRKKLSKFFKDEKLSIPEKENIWLLCSQNEVMWIIGIRMDERFRVTEASENILFIELTKKT
jgi:tRNA(Ile)-lysidine synthase